MVIDVHVHLPDALGGPSSAEELVPQVEEMLQVGQMASIEVQVILGLDYGEAGNRVLKDLVDRFPGQLVPFARGSLIDPDFPDLLPGWVKKYGIKGIKVHQELPFFPLTGLLGCGRLFRKAGELGLPILTHAWHEEEGMEALPRLHTGYFPMMLLEQLGERYPETVFIIAHAGGMWVKAFHAGQPYPNIYFDMSGFDAERGIVETAVEILGPERVLFGSDVPGRSYVAQLAKVRYADISESAKELILGGNAARLLGLGEQR